MKGIHTHRHAHTHAQTHAHTHTHIHTHTHTTHTHTHTYALPSLPFNHQLRRMGSKYCCFGSTSFLEQNIKFIRQLDDNLLRMFEEYLIVQK